MCAERSYFWEGHTVGDAGVMGYINNDEFTDAFRKLTQIDRDVILPILHVPATTEFPFLGLEPVISGSNVRVNPGYAIVDGKLYRLDTPRNWYLSSEGYYRLVLRKTFPATDPGGQPVGQTVALGMLYDATGLGGAPLPTRIDGAIWDVTLAMFRISSGVLAFYPSNGSYIATDATDEYGDRRFPHQAICVSCRLGGHATQWHQPGSTRYAIPKARIEVGSFEMLANPQSFTFVEAFPSEPIVILSPFAYGSIWQGNNICVSAISTTGFSVRADSIVYLDYMQYLAIGAAS